MTHSAGPVRRDSSQTVKCVVWDLDNTVWRGVLLEDEQVSLRQDVVEAIRELDGRGILHSIASRNDHDAAIGMLKRLGIVDYFLHPQINWGAKSASVRAIAEALNLGLDTFAFVDDDEYERAEVAFELPEVRCLDADDAASLPGRPELNPAFVTGDARRRRELYRAEEARRAAEGAFTGPPTAFLTTLDMRLCIARAAEQDLKRAEELTVRTNQLNTTGRTYGRAELERLRVSDRHRLYIARLDDRFGPYGTIGLVLLEMAGGIWTIKLLLTSCRVISRGIGTVMITYLRRLAREAGARLQADFVSTDRNRVMYVTYRMNGFRQVGQDGDLIRLECDLIDVPDFPEYVRVEATGD